ncbi:MAG: M20/M25/M40 family metallo-hydrolase, partial [Chloroflexota bacterium]
MTQDNLAQKITAFFEADQPFILDLIERLVLVESPSDRPETQIGVQQIIKDELEQLDYAVTIIPGNKSGGWLVAEPAGLDEGAAFQMMVGHTDTVWPIGTLEKMPLKREGNKWRGPGVFDMKTGDAMMVAAIRCMKQLGLTPTIAPKIFLNSDEEIGSFESRGEIGEMAKQAKRALVLEPAKDEDGKIKTARKGVGRFVIRAKGKPAHAGLDPTKGASA